MSNHWSCLQLCFVLECEEWSSHDEFPSTSDSLQNPPQTYSLPLSERNALILLAVSFVTIAWNSWNFSKTYISATWNRHHNTWSSRQWMSRKYLCLPIDSTSICPQMSLWMRSSLLVEQMFPTSWKGLCFIYFQHTLTEYQADFGIFTIFWDHVLQLLFTHAPQMLVPEISTSFSFRFYMYVHIPVHTPCLWEGQCPESFLLCL